MTSEAREAAEAISELIKVAGELVLCDGLPDPDDGVFRSMGKRSLRSVRRSQVVRANRIKKAVDAIKKVIKQKEQACE